jgi:hypothetical protein
MHRGDASDGNRIDRREALTSQPTRRPAPSPAPSSRASAARGRADW